MIAEVILIGVGLLVLLADLFLPASKKSLLGILALLGLAGSAWAGCSLWGKEMFLFGHLYILDPYGVFFKLLFLGAAFVTVSISLRYLSWMNLPQGEYFALLLFSTVGMMGMASGTDLLSIYLGLEIMTISSYALVGFLKKERPSLEGALKYFILGAFNSGILLYGIALLYGALGTTDLSQIGERLAQNRPSPMLFSAAALLIAGFAFKISAFPFHMWVPDAYEGSPTPIAGFISVASKAASFAALLRFFFLALSPFKEEWQTLVIFLSIATMTVGNLLALSQESLKRMLAYSSIAHAGYLLIGVAAGNSLGLTAVLFYFIAYAFMNIGAFAMIILLAKRDNRAESIEAFKGLARRHPFWAFCFLIFLLSLAGIPPSAGFIGKFYLFAAAIQSGLYPLALIGVLNSVLALVYYFRVVREMYMTETARPVTISTALELRISLALLAFLTLLAGFYPIPFLQAVQQATRGLL